MKQTAANCPKAPRSAKGDEVPDVRKLKLVPILKRGEPFISIEEALRRARANPLTNHGKRFAMKLAYDLNAGRVLCKNWRLWQHVIFAKDSCRHGAHSGAWCVFRNRDGFYCVYYCFSHRVDSHGRLLRLDA